MSEKPLGSLTFPAALARLAEGTNLGPDDVRSAFASILAGGWTPVQVGAFAIALRIQGETAEMIVAAAQALREAMTEIPHGLPKVIDTCGTGGDGSGTLNLSTAAAVVVAASGFSVAKHGNRSVSSQCGSADVVEALGVRIDVPVARQAEILRDVGIAFLFAPAHHPALRHVADARRELGVRTIFNALGPLVNPARATHQLVGVYDHRLRPIVARALGTLGVTRAWVVRSEDDLDEMSPAAPTLVSELLESGEVRERVVAPEDFGIERVDLGAIAGADASANARSILSILEGRPHPARTAVVLNAAAALYVAGLDADPRACAAKASKVLDEGAALAVLEAWRAATKRHAAP